MQIPLDRASDGRELFLLSSHNQIIMCVVVCHSVSGDLGLVTWVLVWTQTNTAGTLTGGFSL